MQDAQMYRPPITMYYAKIDQLKRDIAPDCVTYTRMIASLYDGDSIFTLADASALRAKIGRVAESIDTYSKSVLTLETERGSREEALKKTIRLACIQYIKDEMLSLEQLPAEEDIAARQLKRRRETEQRIERERRLAMERWEREVGGGAAEQQHSSTAAGPSSFASGVGVFLFVQCFYSILFSIQSAIASLDNWSGRGNGGGGGGSQSDPLVEQINIIKGYIKQARVELRFEEVATLELNLRELQQEFYNRQSSSS